MPVDTRTPEEIDASFKRNLARFEEAKAKFEQTFARKVNEFAQANGAVGIIHAKTIAKVLEGEGFEKFLDVPD